VNLLIVNRMDSYAGGLKELVGGNLSYFDPCKITFKLKIT